tara:strand:+ start:123 stop:2420 length:2298 start_codon:yes stop_codon:yes gene_type:complete
LENNKPKVFAHGSYMGTGGYNNHTRDFFRHLSKLIDVKVRNFTVGNFWEKLDEEPHNREPYINSIDKKLLVEQSLWGDVDQKEIVNHKIYSNYENNFKENINIILAESNHYYYYSHYNGPKIGYNVWESTIQPHGFFNKWKEFDQLWVPSKWQAKCTIEQGVDASKVKVVPEGVDVNTFYPEEVEHEDYDDGRFKFIHFGRWDYRKSTKEIVETFLNTFIPEEPVDLILSADNEWGDRIDGLKTTEERLEYWNLKDDRIKIKHFLSREDYIKYLKKGHVFVSCARSEGWNLPLIEAMACGTPSIYSNCSGQLEFASDKGHPVKILEERPTTYTKDSKWAMSVSTSKIPGNYYEPDFQDLSNVMKDVYIKYKQYKKKALKDAKIIHKDFNWDTVAKIGVDTLNQFLKDYKEDVKIEIKYCGKPKVEILGNSNKIFFVEFINGDTNEIIHSGEINCNMWIECNKKYYINWVIKVNGEVVDRFNIKNKKVLISLDSKSIGDTIAWAPYAVEFSKKNDCDVILSTFHNDWFKGLDKYKNIKFTHPGKAVECYAQYNIGWYKNDDGMWLDDNSILNRCNLIPLQQTATDTLGLEFKELNYSINLGKDKRPFKNKYVVFGPQATSGCKEWVYDSWCKLASKFVDDGYKVFVCSVNPLNIPNTTDINKSLKITATYLKHSDIFVGLGSGLSWLNWALGKHTYMINGFAEEGHEFTSNLTKITNDLCIKCWNDPVYMFDPSNWDWCPVYEGTKLQHICQKSITVEQVFNIIKK